jgi:two-component system cell cycle sensor histidine kinase/response regulator CckA
MAASSAIHEPVQTRARALAGLSIWPVAAGLVALEVLTWSGHNSLGIWIVRLARLAYIGFAVVTMNQVFQRRDRQLQSTLVEQLTRQSQVRQGCAVELAEEREAQTRYQVAMEAANIGFWDFDVGTGEHVWSVTCKQLLGVAPDALANFETFMNAVHPDDQAMLQAAIEKAAKDKAGYAVEFRVRWPDGSVHWLSSAGRVFCDENGEPLRMAGVTMLVDARKETEQRLHLQAVALQAAANAIVIANRKGEILWTNPAFSDLTGYSQEEVLGKTPRLLKSQQHDKAFYRQLWGTITSGKTWRSELVNRRKDGQLYPEEQTITPVLSPGGEVTHFIAIKQDISQRKQAEAALRQAEHNYRTIFHNAVAGMYQSTPSGRLLSVNPACAQICGFESPEQFVVQIKDLARDLYVDAQRREEFKQLAELYGTVTNFEFQIRRPDGKKAWVLQNARVVKDDEGRTAYYEGSMQDITERKLLEEQLRQSQKMEAIGRLAGGVAHDFNNALAVIQGYSELLQSALAADAPQHKHVDEILNAGRRAASLTRQLLAFSRKQPMMPVVLDLNSVVADVEKMLRRLIGEDVELVIKREARLKFVRADRGQLEQVLMNLAVNARDAMPKGGKLLVETRNTVLDESYFEQHGYGKPGDYGMLSVSDTGCGMDKETQARIFEPFFTTKPQGKGTGLGLSTVYGIVKQAEGFISVYSEPGNGSTFRIYLPQVEAPLQKEIRRQVSAALPNGSETILLVEDEDPLRRLAAGCLRTNGYTVLEARDGKSAIELAAQHTDPIHLLLTDVIMPQMSGRELADKLAAQRPEMRVLFMSGYTHDLVTQHGVLESGTPLLEKPFGIETLLSKARSALEGKLATVN